MHPLLTRRQVRPSELDSDPPLTPEHWVWALEALCRSHRVAFDTSLLPQGTAPPHTWSSLQAAAATLGLGCATRNMRLTRMPEDWMPCLVLLRDVAAPAGQACHPAMLIRIKAGQIHYFVPGDAEARRDSVTNLAKLHPGNVLLAEADRSDVVATKPATGAFSTRWLPEILE